MIEEVYNNRDLTFSQKWDNALVIILAGILIFYGYNLREQAVNATSIYENLQAGIRVEYPEKWLLDTNSDDYIMRVRDMTALGFKTTIQISILPVSDGLTLRNLIDQLAIERSQTFTDYSVLATTDAFLPDGDNARSVAYTFVLRETNPFLEGIPSVVVGNDILVLNRGQALILTFRADRDTYDIAYNQFNNFLASLEY